MLKAKFDIEELTRKSDRIALIAPAQELFSWTARSIRIPEGWIALVSQASSDAAVLHSGQICESDDVRDVLLVHSHRLSLSASHQSLESSDGFMCQGHAMLPIRVSADPDDLAALRRTLLTSQDSISKTGLDDYVAKSLQRVLHELSGEHTAAELSAGLESSEIRSAMDRCVGPACLRAGLTPDGLATVLFTSQAWEEFRRESEQTERRRRHAETRGQLREAVGAAQREQLDHFLTVIHKLKNAGGLEFPLTQLLTGLSDAQRGQLYGALWHLPSPVQTRFVAVVSGRELLLFEPSDFRRPHRRIQLPDTFGALRSISSDRSSDSVCIGANTGVFAVELASGQVRKMFRASIAAGQRVRGGFNAISRSNNHVFATHSELGLVAWPLSDGEDRPGDIFCANLTCGATSVRSATFVHPDVWFSVDKCVWAMPFEPDGNSEPIEHRCGLATISSLCVEAGVVYAGDASGAIFAFDTGDPDSRRVIRQATGQPVESLHAMDISGVPMLMVADRSTALTALVVGDQYARRYEAGSAIVRRAAVAPDLFTAINDGRDRLLIWDPRNADAPIASIVIPHLTNTTIQDIALIS